MDTTNPKIYFLLLFLKTGGVELITINLANALKAKGYNVEIICLLPENQLEYMVDSNIKITYIGKSEPKCGFLYKLYWRYKLLNLRQKIKSIHNSIIISTRDEYNVILSSVADNSNLRIGWLHHDYWGNNSLINHLKYKYKNLDKFITLTPDVRDEIKAMIHPFNNHTEVLTIPNFINDKDDRLTTKEKLLLKKFDSDKYCIAVGRLSSEKGFDRLIDIWEILAHKRHGNLKLLLVGDGPEKENLICKISQLQLNDSIFLLGNQRNILCKELIKNAITYCMSSYTEGFSLVLLEAQSVGTPQVAFDVRVGPRNLILDRETGLLVKDGDCKAYADAVLSIANNQDLRKRMSEISVLRSYDFSKEKVLELWKQTINQ